MHYTRNNKILRNIILFVVFTLLVIGFVFLTTNEAFAGSKGSSDSGGGGGGGGHDGSPHTRSWADKVARELHNSDAVDTSGSGSHVSLKTLPPGNNAATVGNDCANCSSHTEFYRNDDGTYNTITRYTPNESRGRNRNRSPRECYIDNSVLSNGASHAFYRVGSVPYDQTCGPSLTRTCRNGNLSGSSAYSHLNCVVVDPPDITGVTVTTDPSIIRSHSSSTVTWDGGNGDTCEISGPNLNSTELTGSKTFTDVSTQSTYKLTCHKGWKTKTVMGTIRVVPVYQET